MHKNHKLKYRGDHHITVTTTTTQHINISRLKQETKEHDKCKVLVSYQIYNIL
jgi:hypothetical protein